MWGVWVSRIIAAFRWNAELFEQVMNPMRRGIEYEKQKRRGERKACFAPYLE